MAWLQNELARAERLGQRVWVMGHIPPGVDPYSTVLRLKNVCKGEPPVMFLSSDKLTDLLVEHGGAIRLAIFAHTHMDEMRMLAPTGRDQHASAGRGTAIKLVPSISPVDGNNPSFTVARIDPATAILQDYQVIAASNQTGVGASWAQEYDYARTYHEAQFSSATVKKLVVKLEADRGAKTDAAQQYIRNYFVGDVSAVLKPFWPQYVCSIANDTAKSYAACVCSTGK
jgi:sphingomyelin phosphodiesterase acid-like 3